MSVEEDTELRDLVVKSLESNGILAKLKAQLRASVFLTLEDENSVKEKIPLSNSILYDFLQTTEGKLVFLLIKDVLEHFNLEYTLSVLEAEARLNNFLPNKNRDELINDVGLNTEKIDTTQSVLHSILLNLQNNFTKKTLFDRKFSSADVTCNENSSSVCITPKPITEIRTTVRNVHNKTFTVEMTDDKHSQSSSVSSDSVDIADKNENDSLEKDNSLVEECIENISDENTQKDESYLIDFEKSIDLITNNEDVEIESEHGILDESLSKIISVKNDINSSTKDEFEDVNTSESIKSLHNLKLQDYSPPKPGDKIEKTKAFNSLTFLQDLPPLNLNKNRTELLPSLYSTAHDITIDNGEKKLSTDLLNCDEPKTTNS